MITVTISEKGGQQSQYDFSTSAVTIGRMKGNDIVLPKGNVSKKHSRISFTEGDFHITDLNSTNGTYVNGRKVTGEQPITENDKIYIGDFILQVEAVQQPNQSPGGPPSPPQASPGQRNRSPSGFGVGGSAASDDSSLPPSPPSSRDSSAGASPLGGGGPVDDLFAAGDSQAPDIDSADSPRPHRRATEGGLGAGLQKSSQPQAPQKPQQDASAEPALDFDDLGFGGDLAPLDAAPANQGGGDLSQPRRGSSAGSAPEPARNPSQPAAAPGGADPTPDPSFDLPAQSASPSADSPRQVSRSQGEEHDRIGGRLDQQMSPGTASPHAAGVPAARELRSEFEADFHAAQHDVARVLFEEVRSDDLPIEYPPMPADRDDVQRHVQEAVNKVSPRVDRDALVELLISECVGLGPIEMYLDDPSVQDIYVNRFDQILIRKGGEMIVARRAFSHPNLLTLAAQRLLGTRDEAVGADEVRFGDGTRVHVVMPPLSVDGPALTIRKPPADHPSLDNLVARNVLSPGMREFLARAVQSCRSILVAGPTSSGKSTLLGAIAQLIPEGTRVVTVEESTHLDLGIDSVVRLEANPATGHDLRYLVRTAVAMHPQRIIVDESRGGDAYEWITSAASGTEGSMITTHGTSATDALGRLESLCLLGNPEISPRGLREQIARAVDVVVVVHRNGDNGIRVRQITEVQGVDLDAFRLNDVFYHRVEGSEEQFHPTGYIPLFYEDLRHAGVEVDFDIFRD